MVDLPHLGQEHLHARPRRLPAPVRADPLRLEGWRRSFLVRGPRSGRCLVLRQAAQERSAPDDEAGGAGRARHPQLVQEPRHRARSVWWLRHDDDRRGAGGAKGAAGGARSQIRRRHRPAMAGGDGRQRNPGRQWRAFQSDGRRDTEQGDRIGLRRTATFCPACTWAIPAVAACVRVPPSRA